MIVPLQILATHEGQKDKGKKATTQEFRIQSRSGLVWAIEFQNRFVFHYMDSLENQTKIHRHKSAVAAKKA